MIEFKLPSLGSDMEQGKLLEWLVKPGEAVKRGQVVAIVNLTARPVFLQRANLPSGVLFDHVRAEEWDGPPLGPYEYRFVTQR